MPLKEALPYNRILLHPSVLCFMTQVGVDENILRNSQCVFAISTQTCTLSPMDGLIFGKFGWNKPTCVKKEEFKFEFNLN